jgi:hypothetical protein
MGRPKGSKNMGLRNAPEAFVTRVERMLKRGDINDSLERHACRLITNQKQPQVAFAVLKMLLEYKFGRPKQAIVGNKENPVSVELVTNVDFAPVR